MAPSAAPATSMAEDAFTRERLAMVEGQLRARGITDPRVLAAMARVPRHRFVPEEQRPWAYGDHPLPIGQGQTISQPYIVAFMTEAAGVEPGERVLEVGTGCGYQAAVLAELGAEVYTIEIVPDLARAAATRLRELGYEEVRTRIGDGWQGWPEAAPFDAILVTAAPPRVPPPLLEQLAPGGRLVIPVGEEWQELRRVVRLADGSLAEESLLPVRFVPLTGPGVQGGGK